MLTLHNLSKLVKEKKRVGRGGSRGGTAGRGHKGQRARTSGNVRPGFEGGQMPLFRRTPKRGFTNAPFKSDIVIINVSQLEVFDNNAVVTRQELIQRGLIEVSNGTKGTHTRVKVLANGSLTKKLIVEANAFSQSAMKAIQDQGGEARLIKET